MGSFTTFCTGAVLALASGAGFAGDGQPPLPVMQGVGAESDARFDAQAGLYTYIYTAHNGAASTGAIGSLFLEGMDGTGPQVPEGWIADDRNDHSLMVSYAGMGPGKQPGSILIPGGEMQFSLVNRGLPVIGTMRLRADWIPEGDGEEDAATRALYARLDTKVRVLVPGEEKAGSFEHWSRVRDDLRLAVKLGWIPDAAFAAALGTQLAAARRAFATQGARAAAAPLQTLLATVEASTPAQRNAAALALLKLNTQALLAFANAAPAATGAPGPVLQLVLDTPATLTVPLGVPATFTGRLTDRANDDKPVAGYNMSVYVGYGPDVHASVRGLTDADGRFSISLQGKTQGTDTVVVGDAPASATVQLVWQGGPDLAMGGFVAPMIRWRGFGPIYMNDTVTNAGEGPAGPATVRYYASPTQPVDPKTAQVVLTRKVPALKPGEASQAPKEPGTFPAALPPGTYYLTACVTIDGGIPDVNPQNDCEDDNRGGMHMMMAVPAMTTHEHP